MLSKEEGLKRLQRYCAYQERCHSEVRSKLLDLKIYGDLLEEIMSELIKHDFLNEQRFAESYVRGKFRIKKWGKQKIVQNLKRKKISDYCIKKGMQTIADNDYRNALSELIKKYRNKYANQGLSPMELHKKCINYCQRKGYEYAVIKEVLNGR